MIKKKTDTHTHQKRLQNSLNRQEKLSTNGFFGNVVPVTIYSVESSSSENC